MVCRGDEEFSGGAIRTARPNALAAGAGVTGFAGSADTDAEALMIAAAANAVPVTAQARFLNESRLGLSILRITQASPTGVTCRQHSIITAVVSNVNGEGHAVEAT
jgi:hypothetical protein